MANEITFSFNARLANGTFLDQWTPAQLNITQAVAGACLATGTATTGGTTVTLPVTTLGVAYFQNTDPTNYCEVNGFLKLLPGEGFVMRLKTGITVTITANTASITYAVRVWNN